MIKKMIHAHCFTRHAFVLSSLRESPRHLNQNFSSSFFKDEGFLPAKEAPGMSFSVRIMLLSADEELDDAMISLCLTLLRPFQPRFHVLESRPLSVAAICEYGVCNNAVAFGEQYQCPMSFFSSSLWFHWHT